MSKRRKLLDPTILTKGIEITCGLCSSPAMLYPGGVYCSKCSEAWTEDFVKKYIKTNGGYQKLPSFD